MDNKLGITSQAKLARAEERISKKKAYMMFKSNFLGNLPPGRFSTLSKIHEYLFDEIYDFAGQVRNCNVSKGNFRFAPVMYLKASLVHIDAMPQNGFDEITEKYVEMNVAHPFKDGNGRTMRIWLDHLLKCEMGLVVDWDIVGRRDYLLAMERSPIKDLEIKHLLRGALTDKVDDLDMFMKGIDASYHYEGLNAFTVSDLLK